MKYQYPATSNRNYYLWFGVVALMLSGVYNSVQVSHFNDHGVGIKFVKRLDEMKGHVVIGRNAASATPWVSLGQRKQPTEKSLAQLTAKPQQSSTQSQTQDIEQEVAEPAITADMNLKLDNVFFKKPLKKGSFSGSAKTVDGYIEAVTINLPNGQTVEINTRDRMAGNVFQFEDTQTGEIKSGMFYEVKKGKEYMITLTNDSQYAGLRLGFKTTDYAEVRYDDNYGEENVQWAQVETQESNSENQDQQRVQETNATQTEDGGYAFNFNQNA